MNSIASELAEALDDAFPPDGTSYNLDKFRLWTKKLSNSLEQFESDSVSRAILSNLQEAASNIVVIRYGDLSRLLPALASWMLTLNATHDSLEDAPSLDRDTILDCLYDLLVVLESVELQEGSLYASTLEAELNSSIRHIDVSARDLIVQGIEMQEVLFEVEDLLDLRDEVTWALRCLELLQTEFPGRLSQLNVQTYWTTLEQTDYLIRTILERTVSLGYNTTDSLAPKSFWWRKP